MNRPVLAAIYVFVTVTAAAQTREEAVAAARAGRIEEGVAGLRSCGECPRSCAGRPPG